MYLALPGFEPTYSVFLDKCVTHLVTMQMLLVSIVQYNLQVSLDS